MATNRSSDGDHTIPHSIPADQCQETVTFPSANDASDGAAEHPSPRTEVLPPAELPVVPGYAVTHEVARGGMGAVYAAHDPAFDRELAVKVMDPGQDAGRFVVEAKVTAQLPHPGVPPVYALGTLSDGRPFLAMKLIRGRTLSDELKATNRADLPRLLDIFKHICETAGFAHSKGIVHRDLKPSNVMVGNFGEVLVMDWGLAKELRNADRESRNQETEPTSVPQSAIRDPQFAETVAGDVKGTPAYMAPEQARGEPVDARADVFALGGILAAILTGKPPFTGNSTADTVRKAARAELDTCFAALDSCGADAELIAVAKKCLAPKAADRYPTGEEVATAVAAYRAGVEKRLRRAERARAAAEAKAEEQRKRRVVQLALAASVLLLACGAGAFAWWLDKQATERKLADERTAADRKLTEERAAADRERAEAERLRTEAAGKAVAARLAGERDAEARNKAEQAQQAVRASLALAIDLRKQGKFKQAGAALEQATKLAKSGAPELLPAIEFAQHALTFAVTLDGIRYRKWAWVTEDGGRGDFNAKRAPAEYRKAFADHGLDLSALTPREAAKRITESVLKAELVAAVDDWALYETDGQFRDGLLEIARMADPGAWTDRLRDPAVRGDRDALVKLAADADPAKVAPATLVVLAELMRRNRLNPAPFLSAARATHPTDFELAFALGQWHANSRTGEQIGPYEAARAIRPDNATVWKNLGVALGWRGDLDGEIAAYRESIRLDPDDPVTHSNLSIALRDKGDLDGGVAEAREAIRLDSKSALFRDTLGNALARRRDLDEAIAAFKEVTELDPKFARAHNNLGTALREKRDLDGAIAAYKAAIEADPRYAIAHNNLGVVLHIKKDLDGAIVAFKEAIRINSKYALAHYTLGLALRDKRDYDGAIEAFKEAYRLDPSNLNAKQKLEQTLRDKAKYEDHRAPPPHEKK